MFSVIKNLDLKAGESIGKMKPVNQCLLLGILRIVTFIAAYFALAYPAGYLDVNYFHFTTMFHGIEFQSLLQVGLVALPLQLMLVLLCSIGIIMLLVLIGLAGGLFEDA